MMPMYMQFKFFKNPPKSLSMNIFVVVEVLGIFNIIRKMALINVRKR